MADLYIETASKFEPKIRKALIWAWNQLRTQESKAKIEKVLREEGIDGVLRLYDNMGIKLSAALDKAINETIIAGAQAGAIIIPSAVIRNPDHFFDVFNPYTAEYIRQYKFDLIKKISDNSREAIRNLLFQDSVAGINPLDTARSLRNSIGLTAKQEKAVRNYKKYLETLDQQALQRALRDKRFDSTIINAIQDGKPLSKQQIERMVNRYRERYIKYRSETIARTESLRAISIGNHQNMQQLIDSGDIDYERVRKYWRYTHDGKARHAHTKIPGMNPEGQMMDKDFITPLGPLMFPRDPKGSAANTINCRCSVFYKVLPLQEILPQEMAA